MSVLVSMHFLIVYFMNVMHASTCSLLWWWYDDDVACSMFRILHNCLNISETKLLPVSDIIFFGKPYSEKIILHAYIKLSTERSLPFYDWKFAVVIYNVKVIFVL